MTGVTSRAFGGHRPRGVAIGATIFDSAMMAAAQKKEPAMNMAGPMGVGNMAQRPVLLRMLWVAYYGAGRCAERTLAASSTPRN